MDIPTKGTKIKFVKGSAEAKNYMEKIRSLRKVKICSEEK